MNNQPGGYQIRKARVADIRGVHELLMESGSRGELLPRSYNELYSHMRDFYVLRDPAEEGIKGCCALTISWSDLAEIRSLVVSDDLQGKGWGKKLVETCLSESVTLGIYRVFTLTYQVEFFKHLDFAVVQKDILPQKVWADCIKCVKFPDCDETAMLIEM